MLILSSYHHHHHHHYCKKPFKFGITIQQSCWRDSGWFFDIEKRQKDFYFVCSFFSFFFSFFYFFSLFFFSLSSSLSSFSFFFSSLFYFILFYFILFYEINRGAYSFPSKKKFDNLLVIIIIIIIICIFCFILLNYPLSIKNKKFDKLSSTNTHKKGRKFFLLNNNLFYSFFSSFPSFSSILMSNFSKMV